MKGTAIILVLLCSCLNVALCQVISGLSPSKPNRLLKTCMSQSGPVNSAPVYNNQPANSVNAWCRTYEKALPCVRQYLPTARKSDPNDWYFSLVYDEEYANYTSNAVCSRLKNYGNKMGCLSADINNAETCVSMLTSPIATYMQKIFQSNQTSDVNKENSLRACLIPVTASRCFKPFFKTCRKGIRKLLTKYFMILSGKCLKIARENKKEPPVKPEQEKPNKEEDSDNKNTAYEDTTINTAAENTLKTKLDDRRKQSVVRVGEKETDHQDKQTARPVKNQVKMRIIQRVIHSDIEREPTNAVMSRHRFKVVPVKPVLTIREPFIRTKDIFLNTALTTKQPILSTSVKIKDLKQTEMLHEDTSEDSEDITPKPNESITVSTTTDKTEDIYIADSQVLSAMKLLTEEEIIHPDESDEVESIILSYDNNTDSSESSQLEPEKNKTDEELMEIMEDLPTTTVGSVGSDIDSEQETEEEEDSVETSTRRDITPTTVFTTETFISEQEESESESEQVSSDEQPLESSKTTKQVSIESTTKKFVKTTKHVLPSLRSQRTGGSHGVMLSYDSLCIFILTFISLFLNVYI